MLTEKKQKEDHDPWGESPQHGGFTLPTLMPHFIQTRESAPSHFLLQSTGSLGTTLS